MTSPDLLNVPLSQVEAEKVCYWANDLPGRITFLPRAFGDKTPEQIALMLRMDGYTSVEDEDVMRAAGRL